ncbi:RNA-directed DNA polymerase, eukaryota [Tanacetum coccineum]
MKEVFDLMEAEVDQHAIDKKCNEIERKNLLIENENLIADCLSKDVFYTAINSVLTVSRFSDMHDAYTAGQKHIAELEAKNSNLKNKIQNDDHDEMIKHFSKLEVEHLNFQLKYQHIKERFGNKKSVTYSDAHAFESVFEIGHLKEQLQGRGNTIRELKWTNPESTQARRTRGRVTGEDEPEMFRNDAIPCPSGAPRKSKSQRSLASSSATSGSSKNRLTEFFQEQIQFYREAKKESLDRELAARLTVVELQKRNEDLKILTFDTTGMNPDDAAKIEALKEKSSSSFFSHIKSKGVWNRIVGSINIMHEKGFIPHSSMQRRVNNGISTKFWYDTWAGTFSLRQQFPRLFRLTLNKDASVRDCWNNGWHLVWSRNVSNGTNANLLTNLLSLLQNTILNDSDDVWVWYSSNSTFTVKDARGKIDDSFLLDDGLETRWNRFLPKKVNIFIWRTLRDRLPSRWNLSRRGIEVASITCPSCDNGIDTSYHSMWVCSLATTLWIRVFKWLDLSPPDIPNLRGLFTWLDDLHISSNKKAIIEVVCGVVLWSLWNFRNDMIFGDTQPKRSILFDKIVEFSFRWYSSRNKLSSISWSNWIQNPIEVYSL